MKVEGIDKLVSRFDTLPRHIGSEVTDELQDIGDDLKDASQAVAPYAPGDSEHLRDKAYSHVDSTANGATLEVGYDGPQGYLLVQHEGGWKNYRGQYGPLRISDYTTPGTGPKFLEKPWLAMKPRAIQRVRDAVQRGMRG